MVLANGRDGLGGPYTPEIFRGLDPRFVMHSLGEIDFSKLRGKTVGVIGAGSTACDCAAEALEHGAAHAAMLVRRADVPRINKNMGIGSAGFWQGFYSLTDAQKWEIVNYVDDQGVPAAAQLDAALQPQQEFLDHRALRGARRGGSRWARGARHHARQARVRSRDPGDRPRGRLEPAAGIRRAQAARPALARSFRAGWDADYAQAEHPYLGAHFEFLPREGAPTWVNRIHCFNYAATMSHGPISGDIPAISIGAERTARGVVNALFAEDYAAHLAAARRLEQSGAARRRIRAGRGREQIPGR